MTAPVSVGYIGGFGRSGSTLLELTLGSLRGLCALGELVHLWERGLRDNQRCGCGQPFHDCQFWRDIGDRAFGGWSEVDVAEVLALKAAVDRNRFVPLLLRTRLPPSRQHAVRRYTDLYVAIYRAAAAMTGATVVLDSSKHVSLAACLRWNPDVDLRLVHVVRDSPGVAYSWGKQVRRPEISDRVQYMPQYSAPQVAGTWLAHNSMFEAVAARGTPRLLVRYEDFAAGPRATLRRITSYLDLPGDTVPPGPEHELPLHRNHTVAGNPLRFTTGNVRVRTDDAWRSALPPSRRRLVAAVTWPLRRHYGYPA